MSKMLKLLSTNQLHTGKVWSVSWNPKGNLLASCGQDKAVHIYQLEDSNHKPVTATLKDVSNLNLEVIKSITPDKSSHTKTIREVAWSPCGKYLGLASFDATVSIWKIHSKTKYEFLTTIEGHESEIKSLAWSPSGDYLATCGRDKQVMIW